MAHPTRFERVTFAAENSVPDSSFGDLVRSLRGEQPVWSRSSPPPSLQVSNSPGDTRICPVNSGLFRVRPCLRVSLCKTQTRILTLRLCIEKFRSRLGCQRRVR